MQSMQLFELSANKDPVLQLLQWVVAVIAQHSTPREQQQGQDSQQQPQGPGQQQRGGEGTQAGSQGEGEPQHEQQQPVHPATLLRQVLDVLLSALLYRHVLSMQQ
jgi:hypothetical protein